jgi:uncharacterized membrane protein YsdA (DUF1294 family)
VVLIGFLFLAVLSVLALLGRLSGLVPVAYGVASLITFAVYGLDKAAAGRGGWRTPEATLHLLALAGGWPGALIAQHLLRHKSRKTPFQVTFWTTVVVNCVALVWLLWPGAATALLSEWPVSAP